MRFTSAASLMVWLTMLLPANNTITYLTNKPFPKLLSCGIPGHTCFNKCTVTVDSALLRLKCIITLTRKIFRLLLLLLSLLFSPSSDSGFQQNYQTFFHTSFRVSSYMSGGDVRMKDLVEACPGVKVRWGKILGLALVGA